MACRRWVIILGILLFTASIAHAATQNDVYIAGYATGVLKHQLMLDIPTMTVQDGIITLPAGSLGTADQSKVMQVLLAVPGVNAVRISETASQLPMVNISPQPIKQFSDTTAATSYPTMLPTGLLPSFVQTLIGRSSLGTFLGRLSPFPE